MQTGLQPASGRLAELSPFGIVLAEDQARAYRPQPGEEGYGCVDWYQYTDAAVEPQRVADHPRSPLRDQPRS